MKPPFTLNKISHPPAAGNQEVQKVQAIPVAQNGTTEIAKPRKKRAGFMGQINGNIIG
jgi:hypothetical protein